MVDNYVTQLIADRKRGDCCNLLRVFCCGEKQRGKEWGRMVHASLRHAFMVELYPDMEDHLGDTLDEDDDERAVRALIQQASRREPVKLTKHTSSLYRKSIQVSGAGGACACAPGSPVLRWPVLV